MTSENLTVGISDHMHQFCIIPNNQNRNNQSKQNKAKFKRDFRKFDTEKVKRELNESQININLNATEYAEEFNKQITSILDKHAPLRKMNNQELKRNEKPWITQEILKKINKKDKG